MSVQLGAGGTVLLGPGGTVATDPACCCGGGGACCVDSVCSIYASRAACEADGGTYLGDGSTCTPVDCTCCPTLARFTTITFVGYVIGCTGGTITLPTTTWTLTHPGFGCDLALFQWSADSDCGCAFQAQNCFPFTESDIITADNTGLTCDSPDYGNCLLQVEFFCNDGTVLLAGSTTTACCVGGSNAQDITMHGPYDITSGSLDVTYASDTNSSISFRYVLTLT